MRTVLDTTLSGIARIMTGVFFRSIEISGEERIPRGVPLVIVANHVNSVADPLLLMAFVEGQARVLAKSTLWSHPVLAPFLVLAGALPVYRHRDAGQNVSRNLSTFARCYEELKRGGSIALFPEGTSHNMPHRLPLKTGAARIALGTVGENPGTGLRILPVGLVYEAKDRFRSRVLINVGEPIDPESEMRNIPMEGRAAVRALTERIADRLETVTTSYESWDEARLLNLAAAAIGDATLEERFARSRAFLTAYRELRGRDPDRALEVARMVGQYEAHLRNLALVDDDVTASSRRNRAWLEVLAFTPLGIVGGLANIVPYKATDWVTRYFARTPDEPATYMLFTALLAFPTFWLGTGVVVSHLAGPIAGLIAAILAPLSGLATLRLREAVGVLRLPRPPTDLVSERAVLAETIRELAGLSTASTRPLAG